MKQRVTQQLPAIVNHSQKAHSQKAHSYKASSDDLVEFSALTDTDLQANSISDPNLRALSIEALTARDAVVDGTQPTPDQNVVEDLAMAVGISNLEGHPLRTLRILNSRDHHRWELEPESSEDYAEHCSQ